MRYQSGAVNGAMMIDERYMRVMLCARGCGMSMDDDDDEGGCVCTVRYIWSGDDDG